MMGGAQTQDLDTLEIIFEYRPHADQGFEPASPGL